jgi:hypothetical protein
VAVVLLNSVDKCAMVRYSMVCVLAVVQVDPQLRVVGHAQLCTAHMLNRVQLCM